MRDLDFTRPEEEAIHKQKRGFYPLQAMNQKNHLPDSTIINGGISRTLGNKYYFEIPDVPFIKSNFSTRIYYSEEAAKTAWNTRANKDLLIRNFSEEVCKVIKQKLLAMFNQS